jgi:hypothetical protein
MKTTKHIWLAEDGPIGIELTLAALSEYNRSQGKGHHSRI